jgi:cellulose biosynthesis protein BcsQ
MGGIKMKSIIFGFISSKGGSGKTVTATSFASILSELDKKVLLIDTDASTNGLTLLFLEELINFKQESDAPNKLRGIFEIDKRAEETLIEIKKNLFLLPSTYILKQTEDVPPEEFREHLNLILDRNSDIFDYIIIDAQAGSDIYAKYSINKCDYKIIVSEYDPISAEGVERLKQIFAKELPPEKTWILLNKVLPDFADKLSSYMSVYKFLSPIPWDADVIKSFAKRKININTKNINVYTFAIIKTIKSLGLNKLNDSIDEWINNKELEIKEPAKKQIEELNAELSKIEDVKIDLEYKLRDQLNRTKTYTSLMLIMASSLIITSLGYTIVKYFTKSIDIKEQWIYIAMGISIIPIFIFTFRDFFQRFTTRKNRDIEKKIMSQIKYYERTLEELKSKKEKLDLISFSDLEDIVKKK